MTWNESMIIFRIFARLYFVNSILDNTWQIEKTKLITKEMRVAKKTGKQWKQKKQKKVTWTKAQSLIRSEVLLMLLVESIYYYVRYLQVTFVNFWHLLWIVTVKQFREIIIWVFVYIKYCKCLSLVLFFFFLADIPELP